MVAIKCGVSSAELHCEYGDKQVSSPLPKSIARSPRKHASGVALIWIRGSFWP